MPTEIIAKKLEQIRELINELSRILNMPFENFRKDLVAIRASERNFQLIV